MTNPLGPGMQNLIVNMAVDMRAKLEKLAAENGVKLSVYVRCVLIAALSQKISVADLLETNSLRRGVLKYELSLNPPDSGLVQPSAPQEQKPKPEVAGTTLKVGKKALVAGKKKVKTPPPLKQGPVQSE